MSALRRTAVLGLLLVAANALDHEDASAQTIRRPLDQPVKRMCPPVPLLAHYTFDDVLTDTVGTNPAFVAGSVAPTFGAGRLGKALYFTNGASAKAAVKNPPSTTYTAAEWILQQASPSATTCFPGSGCVVCSGGSFAVSAFHLNMVGPRIEGGGMTNCPTTPKNFLQVGNFEAPAKVNAWTHIALVFDGAVGHVYQDGKEVGTASEPLQPALSRTWTLGEPPTATRTTFVGAIDDLRLYGVALDASQVAALSAGSEPRTACDLKVPVR